MRVLPASASTEMVSWPGVGAAVGASVGASVGAAVGALPEAEGAADPADADRRPNGRGGVGGTGRWGVGRGVSRGVSRVVVAHDDRRGGRGRGDEALHDRSPEGEAGHDKDAGDGEGHCGPKAAVREGAHRLQRPNEVVFDARAGVR